MIKPTTKTIILASSIFLLAAGCNSATQPTTNTTTGSNTNQTQNSSSTATSGQTAYTMADVQAANSASKCYAVINGKVYDLTSWINKHPGGPDKILSICGKDGTAAFMGQHGGQARPANELTNFYIGVLK